MPALVEMKPGVYWAGPVDVSLNYPTDLLMNPLAPAFSFPSFSAFLLGPPPAPYPAREGCPESGGEGQGDGRSAQTQVSQLGQAQSQVKWTHSKPWRKWPKSPVHPEGLWSPGAFSHVP